jgi:hypothetical protein
MEYLEYDKDMKKADKLESFRTGWTDFLTYGVPNDLSKDDVLIFNTGAHWTKKEGKSSGTVVSGISLMHQIAVQRKVARSDA